jgi:ABC-2 type transport system permease protein
MVGIYLRLVGANIRSQMQYRASFWLDMLGFGLLTGVEFASTVLLLRRFGSVGGWSIYEVAVLYGLSSMAFGVAEMAGRGFDKFSNLVQAGSFDTLLTRPLDTFLQVLGSEFQLRRLGRIAQGAAVLAYALARLRIDWTVGRALVLPITVASGAAIFIALLLVGATMCFWTVRTPEIINVVTSGGQQLNSYPLHIFNRWVRDTFLFVVPVAFCSYPAGLLLLGREDPNGLPAWSAWGAPAVAAAFFAVALAFWRHGVRKYTSTGT